MPITINGSTGIAGVDGSASTPAIQGTDTNTGVTFPAADTVAVSTGGSERMRVDSSGNVGIGTSSPATTLHIKASTAGAFAGFRIEQNDGYAQIGTDDGALLLYTSTSERARIDSSGNLLVGQTSTTTPPSSTKDIYCGGISINTTSRTSSGSANVVWSSNDGFFYRSTSSLRYKHDIKDADFGIADVMKLRPVTYLSKSPADGDKRFAGFIAEEIHDAGLQEFVVYDNDGNPDALAYANMVSLLTKSIQELKAELDDAKARIAALEAK